MTNDTENMMAAYNEWFDAEWQARADAMNATYTPPVVAAAKVMLQRWCWLAYRAGREFAGRASKEQK